MKILLLAISLFVLSQSALLIRLADAPAAVIGMWRLNLACLVLFGITLQRNQFKKYKTLSKRQWRQLLLCSLFLFTHWLTWFVAVQKTTAANALIIFSLNPLISCLGAWLWLGDHLNWKHAISLSLCFLGIATLLIGKVHLAGSSGELIALLSAVFFAGYILSSKKIRMEMNNLPFTFFLYSNSALLFTALAISTENEVLPKNPQFWIAVAALAIGPTLIGHALFTYCLGYFNVSFMSVATLTEPILAAITAHYFLQENITSHTVGGFLLVTLGIIVLFANSLTLKTSTKRES